MLALCTYLLSVVAGCVLYMGGCGWVCIVHGWVWLGVYCTWVGVAGCVLYMDGCGWVCMVRSASTGLLLQGHSDGVNHVSCIGDAKYGSLDDLLHQL